MRDAISNPPPRIYAHGAIGRSVEIAELFKPYNPTNPSHYQFGDPSAIYYLDKNNEIKYATPESDLYYVIKNSDWVELKPKQPRKIRKYIITVKEGSPSCDGCEFGNKCPDNQRLKCTVGQELTEMYNLPELAWKTMELEDVTDFSPLPISILD